MPAPHIEIDETACVRAILLQASCTDCQKACPVEAIDLTARAPVIDRAACTLCEACVGVCPETVFARPTPISAAQGGAQGAAQGATQGREHFIACQCHPCVTASDPAALRCIHSIGLADLAQMWLDGMRRLLVATDSCAACAAAPTVWIEATVADFNRLAHSRDLEGIELLSASHRMVEDRQKAQGRPDASRRRFLRALVPPPTPQTEAKQTEAKPADALQQFLAQGPQPALANSLYPFAPQIDPAACVACDDCVNICPHGALTLIKAKGAKSLYHCAPECCTGCGLCCDICDQHAVEVFNMGTRGADLLLERFQCRACGVQSHNNHSSNHSNHSSHAQFPTDGLCRICQQTGHHKNLYVVLD